MTSAVETTPDIEAWLNRDVERSCQMFSAPLLRHCGRRAEWIAHARFEKGCRPASRFFCDLCRQNVGAGLTMCCPVHRARAHVTWIERTRGPKGGA